MVYITQCRLKARNDGSYEAFSQLGDSERQTVLTSESEAYRHADTETRNWGIGGSKSRAVNAGTILLTGILGGKTDLQTAANTLSPYAAAAIGNTFGHGEDKNETAQLVGHFLLGATLSYINGGDPLSGGGAAVAAEKAAQYLSQQYNDGKSAIDPQTGEFNPNLLPEQIKEEIKSTTGVIASIVGATGDGGAALNAQIGGALGQNAVENNDVGASFSAWRKEQELLKTDPAAYARLKAEQRQAIDFLVDFIPVIGDIKGFAEAQTKGDYLFAAMGIIPLYGDAAKKVHQAEKAYEAAKAAKDVGKMKAAMNEARKGADLPYDSQKVRVDLELRYGAENVRSTTVPPSNARNVKLAGRKHPVTGIVFDKKGFPIFDDIAKYDTKLNVAKFGSASYQEQMRMATRELREKIQSGKISTSQFTPSQLQAIKNGDAKIPELTWHHHQDKGRMQLIPEDKHKQTGHIGGDSMQKGK